MSYLGPVLMDIKVYINYLTEHDLRKYNFGFFFF